MIIYHGVLIDDKDLFPIQELTHHEFPLDYFQDKNMNRWRIEIEADTNDGDYITSINVIDDQTLALIRPVVEAIKNFQPYQSQKSWGPVTHSHNFPYGHEYYPRTDMGEKTVDELYGHLGEEALETFKNLLPCGDDIHTIESVKVMPITKVEVLL